MSWRPLDNRNRIPIPRHRTLHENLGVRRLRRSGKMQCLDMLLERLKAAKTRRLVSGYFAMLSPVIGNNSRIWKQDALLPAIPIGRQILIAVVSVCVVARINFALTLHFFVEPGPICDIPEQRKGLR